MLPLVWSLSFLHFGWYFVNCLKGKETKEAAKRRRVWNYFTKVQTTKQLVDQANCFSAQQFVLEARRRLEKRVNGKRWAWAKASFIPIRLVPLSLVVSRTLVSLPFRTGVGWAMAAVLWAASTTTYRKIKSKNHDMHTMIRNNTCSQSTHKVN